MKVHAHRMASNPSRIIIMFCGSQSLGVVSTSVLLESSVRVRSLLRSLAELLIVPMAVKVRWVRISPNDGAV